MNPVVRCGIFICSLIALYAASFFIGCVFLCYVRLPPHIRFKKLAPNFKKLYAAITARAVEVSGIFPI